MVVLEIVVVVTLSLLCVCYGVVEPLYIRLGELEYLLLQH